MDSIEGNNLFPVIKNTCPICKKENLEYYESSHKEPFVHTIPFIGLMMYGCYSSEKFLICQNDEYIHFGFYGAEDERLVKLGVENSKMEQEMIDGFGNSEPDFDDEYDYEDEDDDEENFPLMNEDNDFDDPNDSRNL